MDRQNNKPVALVTGGSKGIGYEIAKALARHGYSLVLVSRNEDELTIAKNALEDAYPVNVDILSYDLTDPHSADDIYNWLKDRKLQLQFLCNVAGIGGSRDYLSIPLEQVRFMIQLNIESMMAVTMKVLPLLKTNNPSYILNVSSLAGFSPIPVKNVYSATKSAIIFFSYSLKYQLIKDNISVSCLCPGPVFTKPEIRKDTIKKMGRFGLLIAVDAQKVGEMAVSKTLSKKLIIVPGTIAGIAAFLLRVIPKRILCYVYYKLGVR